MSKIKFDKKFFTPLVLIFLVIIFLELTILFKGNLFSNTTSAESLNNYADMIIKTCSNERYHPACYDREIPKLMDSISMEDSFKVTGIIQSKDKTYPYCHVLGHELSAREVDKDPSKWKDVVARVPSGICSNGGIHGAFQERYRAESFTPEQIEKNKSDLMDICEQRPGWNPTGLEQGSCYHALGHLTMYMTKADIKPALKLCDELATKLAHDYSQICYDGVFMQIFQPLEPEDFDLIAGKEVKKGQLESYCKNFNGKQRSSCWSEGWPLVYDQIMKPSGLVKHCSSNILQNKEDNDRCYMGLFYVISAQLKLDPVILDNFCKALPSDRSGECYSDGAGRMIETDYKNIPKAVSFCASANTTANQDACFEDLVKTSVYDLHKGSSEFLLLCNSLPGEWKDKCLNDSN